jgi:hypothetical protein
MNIFSKARPEPSTAEARTITNANNEGSYRAAWVPVRPGADDHENVPSRTFDKRVFRDGRVEDVKGGEA